MATEGVIHIAGLPVTIDGHHIRQRCAWCGALLEDQDLRRTASTTSEPYPTWDVGALVLIDGNMKATVEREARMPSNCCANLSPEVTR
jgi:hypothetical protein